MNVEVCLGLLIPFIGTALGAACVYFMRGELKEKVQKILTGFAAGVMLAASIFSLILPAIEQGSENGKWAVMPAFVGFWLGVLFLLVIDTVVPHLHNFSSESEGIKAPALSKQTMMLFAVAIHNIPEGMAVGVVFAGYLQGNIYLSLAAALSLSIGIAIQNFPEGAIVSMPLHSNGLSKNKAFLYGCLSGIVEPLGAVLTIFFSNLIVPALPYLLSFAAGAMIYVVVEELIPEMMEGSHSNWSTVFFSVGFSLMMVLDVVLG
ncbi:MAG: ZIP family metal transporter [Erysipelotrichaceae bacterium]